jgi:hypothetical protein
MILSQLFSGNFDLIRIAGAMFKLVVEMPGACVGAMYTLAVDMP